MSAERPSLNWILGALCVCLLVTLSACTASVDSRVEDEETIALYVLEIVIPEDFYNSISSNLKDQGYDPSDPFRDALLTDLDVYGGRVGDLSYDSDLNETSDSRTIVLTVTDFSPSEDGNVTLRVVNNRLIYEDKMLSNQTTLGRNADSAQFQANYFLTMPYDIVQSNADVISGPTAEWHRSSIGGQFIIRAESRIPIPPIANFTTEPGNETPVVGETILLDASGSTDDIGVTSYQWNFGDGKSATGQVVLHRYANPGEYDVQLTVVDGDEFSDVMERTIVVEQAETPTSTRTASSEPTTPPPSNGIPWLWVALGVLGLVVLAAVAYLLTRSGGDDTGGEEAPDETVPPAPPSPEWSGLVIDEVRRRGDTTDVVVRNATTETWTAAGKTIEDARGNRNPLPETLAIAPGSAEFLRFDRKDDDVFESEEGEDVLLHTEDGERTVLWEEPEE